MQFLFDPFAFFGVGFFDSRGFFLCTIFRTIFRSILNFRLRSVWRCSCGAFREVLRQSRLRFLPFQQPAFSIQNFVHIFEGVCHRCRALR